ncbi:hypothetical protein F5B22DRAFT_635525 [Xylaria bambusicola]|uniref:uncharacterized protein n=1 Tax=Xylaria bambusicola TaxID=326684 RepID=UPI002007A206|nr:uncharacterized protein F5B22DRAFT_635525 [Xylaria bambusicola]KAI0518035.1 hypothetical protein F5B22DRAFT_635525 [Xylaria bambusicola]
MSQAGGRGHIFGLYRPPSGDNHDRHIQHIIDHTSSLFPETSYPLPQTFTSASDYCDQDNLNVGLDHMTRDGVEYNGLDDFDRTVLGHPRTTYHSPSTRNFPSNGAINERISLPLYTSSDRPRRVLEDASHYFRPFVPRDPDHPSQFQSIPNYLGDRLPELNRAFPICGAQDPSLEFPYQLLARNPLAQVARSQHLPSTQLISNRNSTRDEEIRFGRQLFAQPLYAEKTTPPIHSSLSSSSPSQAVNSSPSVRISQEKQKSIFKRNSALPKWNQKFQLDLDHASYPPPIVNNTLLIDPRQSLPDKFRAIFPFQLFNVVQSKCFPLVYGTNDNVVISAPTGSGKTAILEMAICKLVSTQGGGNYKIIYQAPTKSLCSEKARDWQAKFSHMNLHCVELTGDTSQAEARRIGSASIIVTTPEKWDSITRKWKDHMRLLELVRLVLIDEVHILKDTRGATLEAVVSRMKTIGASIRFVAISATVPNIKDIAIWLGRDHENQHEPARHEVFGEELRPVKLQRHVYGYDGAPNDFIFEKSLDGKLNLLIAKHSKGKPIMVFCFTRKSCERTAQSLAEWWSTCRNDDRPWPPPNHRIPVISQDLQELTRYGVAFHHAGLEASDRAAIEREFLNGQLHLICCTSTLAVGVNLPCHTVVLKGTNHYTDDGPQEYSDLEVIQMLGRAGRPQFDSRAIAIIMTRTGNVQRYEKLVSGEELLESTLHQNLLEHLNSEIGLGTIQDIQTAKKWIGGTFLSVRVRQSPSLYNLQGVQSAAGADEQMEEWCERDVKLLQDNGLVTQQIPLKCTEYGQAMSRYMIKFDTMRLLLSIPRAAGVGEMLTIICKDMEFKDFKFKPTERAVFRELNKSPLILHQIKETLSLTWHKIFMIVQIYLGGVDLPTDKDTNFIRQDLLRERRMVFDRLKRLVRCVIDCKAYEGDGLGTQAALELHRSIEAQAWENKPAQLSQIPGFGPVAVRKWVSFGVRTVLEVADKDIHDIERIASRNPPYGRNVQKILEKFPRLTLKADLVESTAPRLESNESISVTVKAHLGHRNTKTAPYWKDRIPPLTFIALTSDGTLAYFWRGSAKKLEKSSGLDIKFPVALTAPNQKIFCHFSCESVVGTQVTVNLEPKVPASVFRKIRKQEVHPTASTNVPHIEEDYEDISDEAMLEALNSPRIHDLELNLKSPEFLDKGEEDFPLIDEILSEEVALTGMTGLPDAPLAKMDNGRYLCNHHCRNGGLTKLGKPCNHKCCQQGVEKYRPPKLSKVSGNLGGSCENRRADHCEGGKKANSTLLMTPHDPKTARTRRKGQDHPGKTPRTKKRSLDGAHIPRRAKLARVDSSSSFSNIEFIDLCDSSDNSSTSTRKPPSLSRTRKQRYKLLHLHENVKSDGILSPRLTKSHKAQPSPGSGSVQGCLGDDGRSLTTIDVDKAAIPAGDEPLGDTYDDDDMSDLPGLDELLGGGKVTEVPEMSENASPRMAWANDETLYPGVVHSLKESMEYG